MARIAIAGAGNIAFTNAALLGHFGQEVAIWSPSSAGTRDLARDGRITASGWLNGSFAAGVAEDPRALAGFADVIMTAVPAYAQKAVFDQLLPWLTDDHLVVVSGGQMSFATRYMLMSLRSRGLKTAVAALHNPVMMGRKVSSSGAALVPVARQVRIGLDPDSDAHDQITRLTGIFGDRFVLSDDMIAAELSAIGGVVHAALALCNLTRIEQGEEWCGYGNTTESVGRLTETLDAERVAVGAALGYAIASIVALYSDPAAPPKTMQEIFQPITYQRTFRNGPRKITTRYIEEEIPYNLVSIELIGRLAGVATPVMS